MRYGQISGRGIRVAANIGRGFERALLPRSCAFCGVDAGPRRAPVCDDCAVDLPWIETACPRCAMPIASPPGSGDNCGACQSCPPPFDVAVAPLAYAFPIDAAIKAMKFDRRLHYLPAFAYLLGPAIQSLPGYIDGLLPVPLHWRRHAYRGFNQSDELARLVGKALGLPVFGNVRRRRATPYQSGLSAAQRRRNLRAAFTVRGELQTQYPLIIDDVITTSETCCRMAQVLLEAGAKKVSVLALARASTD